MTLSVLLKTAAKKYVDTALARERVERGVMQKHTERSTSKDKDLISQVVAELCSLKGVKHGEMVRTSAGPAIQ